MATLQGGRSDRRKRAYSQEEWEQIRTTVASGASEDEIQILLLLARKYDLDPLSGEINWHAGHYFVSAAAMSRICQEDPTFGGVYSFVVCAGDEIAFNLEEGLIRHHFGITRGRVVGAWAACCRRDRRPSVCYVDGAHAMQSYPVMTPCTEPGQLQVLAELQAMRKQFGHEELQTHEEWAYAGRTTSPHTQHARVQADTVTEELTLHDDDTTSLRTRIDAMRAIKEIGQAKGLSAADLRALVEEYSPGVRVPSMPVLASIRARLQMD